MRRARGRYHLYVALSCPWAHRTLIFRALKRLEDVISLSVVSPLKDGRLGLRGLPRRDPGQRQPHRRAAEVYLAADPRFTGRVTVPVLWDKERATIVNNESPEIIRMFNSAFDAFTDVDTDYYPAALRGEIDEINALVYANVNNGVYRAGFASTQDAYEEAFRDVFGALDRLEAAAVAPALSGRRERSPRPTGGCSSRWCASTPPITGSSSATCAG